MRAARMLLLAGIAVMLILVACTQPLEEAQREEVQGNYQAALDYYCLALKNAEECVPFPAKKEAGVVAPSQWRATAKKYLTRVSCAACSPSATVGRAMEGIVRCTSGVFKQNFFTGPDSTSLIPPLFRARWRAMFFPGYMEPDTLHLALADTALAWGLSLLQLNTLHDYSYEGLLIHTRTGHLTGFHLYPQSRAQFPVVNGEHLLCMRSSVTFPGGEVWQSGWSVQAVTVPQGPLLLDLTIKTKVQKQKGKDPSTGDE